MARKIQAYTEFGPRLEPATPLSGDELIEQITEGSNESMSSVLAVLSALDSATEQALKAGRIVQLPNGTHYRPIGKQDGTIKIKVRDPEAWYLLCIKRYTMEHMSATKEEWLALANEFSKQKSPACAEKCRRMAKCCL